METANPLLRKISRIPLSLRRLLLSRNQGKTGTAIFVNSFPKSGTHLLSQILESMPGVKDFGYFITNATSFRFRLRSKETMYRLVENIRSGELVRGHLQYSNQLAKKILGGSIAHYFIYRDPRDIVLSEAYYLTYMNKWHKLHKYFWKHRNNFEDCIELSIKGLYGGGPSGLYLNINQRFQPYTCWLYERDVFKVKFEDLVSNKRQDTILNIVRIYKNISGVELNENELVSLAINHINPGRSHTFRVGKSGGWRDEFTNKHKTLFKDIAGELLIRLGYEDDLNW